MVKGTQRQTDRKHTKAWNGMKLKAERKTAYNEYRDRIDHKII